MKIGDKVVCIEISESEKAGSSAYDVTPSWPKVGTVYVIRGFGTVPEDTSCPGELTLHFSCPGELTLHLIGHKCIYKKTNQDIGFFSLRFRLLDEMKAKQRQIQMVGVSQTQTRF